VETSPGATDATAALLEVLRDETAREALIAQLEATLGQAPAEPEKTGEANAIPQTFAAQVVAATRSFAVDTFDDLRAFYLRLGRVPNTMSLAVNALDRDVLEQAAAGLARIVVSVYGVLIAIRLLLRPFRLRLSHVSPGTGWVKRAWRRILVTILDGIAIPVATFVAFAIMFWNVEGGGELSFVELTFIGAFVAVEATRVLGRFVLSPHSASLRIIALSDAAASSLWRHALVLLYLLGYGQLLVVPIVQEQTSIFAGRAVSSLLGMITVLVTLFYVLWHRQTVAAWAMQGFKTAPTPEATDLSEAEDPNKPALAWWANRWHWPVIAYLVYLFAVVATRPGNVLLPLLLSTARVVAVIVVGLMLLSAINWALSRRLKVPSGVAHRLPLLEERLNQMVPAALMLLRLVLVVAVAGATLQIIGFLDFNGLLTTIFGAQAGSRVLSAGLVVLTLALVWLAVSSWVDYRLNPFVGTVPTPREITLLTLVRNGLTIVLVVLGILMSLAQLGMNIGPLLASAGVLGLAISFGAQRMVEDIITGVFIQLENAMNVGDVVDVGGTIGTVEKLTVRSVTLRDLTGSVHMVPFSSATKISNYMRDFAYHVADMGVAYREDVDDVRQAMHDAFDALREEPDIGKQVIDDLEWFGLNSFGDSALVVRARIKTVPGQQWAVGRAYNVHLKRIFDARGIEIPFPHQTIYFGTDKTGHAPAVRVHMEAPQAPERPNRPAPEPEQLKRQSDEALAALDMPDVDLD